MIKKELENVDIELSNRDFFLLAKMAHEQDITFNELCTKILEEKLEEDKCDDGID
jgi:hypothetical protein